MPSSGLKRAYLNQSTGAKRRGIPFLISFEDWMKVWEDSGKLHLRGRGKGKYVMGRIGDTGPYSVDNVFILLNSDNVSQGSKGKTPWNKGRTGVYSKEVVASISQKMKGNTSHEKRKSYGNRHQRGIPK